MGKSLNGKELGKGITQRKDGTYQGRFTNRFGKRQTVYGKTLTEVSGFIRIIILVEAVSFCISLKLSDNAVSILGIIFRNKSFNA